MHDVTLSINLISCDSFPEKTVQMQTTFNSSHLPMQPMAVGSGSTIQSIQPNEGIQPAQVVAPIPVPNMSSSSSGLQKWRGGRFLQWTGINE